MRKVDDGVRVSTLANGLRVVTDPMDGVESVSLGVWVGAGTRDEPAAVNGVSHLLEHMAFKGTERRTARDIAEAIEAVGGHINAHTARDHTAYWAKVLAEDVGLAVDILADILAHSVVDADELAREKAVVLQEIGQALDTPDDIVFDRFQEAAFPAQAMGRPVLGTAETVSRTGREEVLAYLAGHYAPSRMVLAAAGSVGHEAFLALADAAFGALAGGGGGAPEPACYAGGERREERALEQVHLVLGFPGVAYREPDFYAASVFSTLLGGGMSSRLFQEIREERGLVYAIYTFLANYADGGLFGVYAGTGEEEAGELLPLLCAEMERAARAVTEEELARARTQITAGVRMARESTGARCERLGRHLLFYGRPLPVSEIVAAIDAVDGEAIRRVAGRLLAGRPSFAAIGPLTRVEDYDSLAARFG